MDSLRPIDAVLSHYPDARKSGAEWVAHCTGHRDTESSLCIREAEDGRVLLHCHAGCDKPTILRPVGLSMSDLYPRHEGGARPEPEKTYDYRNEKGELVFQKVRYPGKRFSQRRPDANGGWIWDLKDTQRVLYRLPDLLKASAAQPVFIVEGEKDADRLWREGLAATTNVEGASKPGDKPKWREEYTQCLKERLRAYRFVLLPDNDGAGQAHAEHVARSLTAAGLQASVLKLPGLAEKGDASDWFDAGNNAARLLELAAPAPARIMLLTFAEVCAMTEPVWQVEDLYEEQTLVEWFGLRGRGKSLTVLDLALTNCKGQDGARWCGRRLLKMGPVCWVNADGGRGMVKRLNAWKEIHGGELHYPFLILGERDKNGEPRMGRVRLNTPWEIEELLDALHGLPEPPAMIVFDTLSRCIPGTDENLQGPMTLVTDQCHRLRAETGASVHLIHHTDKQGKTQRGSDVVPNEADYVIRVFMDRDVVYVSSDKARDGEKFKPFELQLHRVGNSVVLVQREGSDRFEKTASGSAALETAREILAALEQMPGATVSSLSAATEIPETTIRRHLKEAAEAGHVRWERSEAPAGGGQRLVRFWCVGGGKNGA